MSRWGIIYCPKAGEKHSHQQWEKIGSCLKECGVEYDFVQSDTPEAVERLATMLASNGYRRIVIVGGDSALNRALNGILTPSVAERRKDIELAVIPNGFVNDFAHYWGFDDSDIKKSVEWLASGRVRTVDVGYIDVTTDGNAGTPLYPRRHFLNCVNIGLASDLISIRRTSRKWGVLRYVNRSLSILFRRKESRVHLRINRDEIDDTVMNVCVGSCRGYGLTPNAVPYSGMLDISITRHPHLSGMGKGLYLLASGRFLNFKETEAHRTRSKISVFDTGGALVSLDGLILPDCERRSFTIGLLPEHIKFIIPPISN